MVSNCTCTSAVRTSGGRSSSRWMYFSRSLSSRPSSCGGGGTKAALPGRVPPIQFWLRRISPGCLFAPRPPFISLRWASFRSRIESGGPLGACLEREQVHKRRLCSLDLRRYDRLFANEGVHEPFDRRHHPAGQAEPAELLLGGL